MIQLVGARPGRRLLDERDDLTVVAGRDHAERRRIVDLRQRDRRLGAARLVELDERADVEVGEHVAVADDQPLVDALRREADAARGPERLRLLAEAEPGRRTGPPPRWVVGEVLAERLGEVAERKHDVVDAVAREPGELAIEERQVRDRQQPLGRLVGERPEARPLTTDEDDRLHGVLAAGVVGSVVDDSLEAAAVDRGRGGAAGVDVDARPAAPPRSSMFASADSASGGSGTFWPFGRKAIATMSAFCGPEVGRVPRAGGALPRARRSDRWPRRASPSCP